MIEIQDPHWSRILNNDGMPRRDIHSYARKKTLPDAQREQARALSEIGLSAAKISKQLKCNKTAVLNAIREAN